MEYEEDISDLLAMRSVLDEQREQTFRRMEDAKRRRLQALPEPVRLSLHQPEHLLPILLELKVDELLLSLTSIAYDLTEKQGYRFMMEHFLETKSFDVSVRIAAASGLGGLFAASKNKEICTQLRKYLLDESEPDGIRERCYFSLLHVKDVPPFPTESLGSWNKLFDDFRFPQDVNWALVWDD